MDAPEDQTIPVVADQLTFETQRALRVLIAELTSATRFTRTLELLEPEDKITIVSRSADSTFAEASGGPTIRQITAIDEKGEFPIQIAIEDPNDIELLIFDPTNGMALTTYHIVDLELGAPDVRQIDRAKPPSDVTGIGNGNRVADPVTARAQGVWIDICFLYTYAPSFTSWGGTGHGRVRSNAIISDCTTPAALYVRTTLRYYINGFFAFANSGDRSRYGTWNAKTAYENCITNNAVVWKNDTFGSAVWSSGGDSGSGSATGIVLCT